MVEPLKVITQEESWKQTVDESIIALLEEVLEKARAGEYQSVVIAGILRDDSTFYAISAQNNTGLTLAAVTRLQHKLLHHGE